MRVPWIRVHGALIDRPVITRMVDALRIKPHEAVGILATFWGAVASHASNGFVADYSDSQLEVWARWTRPRGAFAKWVRGHHLDDDGRIRDWDEYAGKLELRREADRQRKSEERRRMSDGQSAGHPHQFHTRTRERNGTERNVEQTTTTATGSAMLLALLPTTRKAGMKACLDMWSKGNDLPPGTGIPTGKQIDDACRDVVASCEVGQIRPNVVRSFLVRAMIPDKAPASGKPKSFTDALLEPREGAA